MKMFKRLTEFYNSLTVYQQRFLKQAFDEADDSKFLLPIPMKLLQAMFNLPSIEQADMLQLRTLCKKVKEVGEKSVGQFYSVVHALTLAEFLKGIRFKEGEKFAFPELKVLIELTDSIEQMQGKAVNGDSRIEYHVRINQNDRKKLSEITLAYLLLWFGRRYGCGCSVKDSDKNTNQIVYDYISPEEAKVLSVELPKVFGKETNATKRKEFAQLFD